MRPTRIVVGVDGSTESDRAAELAGDLAELTGGRVLAIHAVGLLEGAGSEGQDHAARRQELGRALETTWTRPIRRTDVDVRCELRTGHPVDVLLSAIDEIDADLVIVGSRGIGEVPAQLLGSTSAQLACVAPCPILIVPPADRSVRAPGV